MPTPDFFVGIIGNILSILVCASPVGTFREVVKKKSVENYDGLPYISTLLCRSLWVFYGVLHPSDGLLIITVNSVGVGTQVIYVTLFLIYAPKDKKVKLMILVAILNIVAPTLIIVLALLTFHGCVRRIFVGVVCATVTVGMYVAPLLIMRTVVKMKSVEYMSFSLSFLLFLNAGAWFTFAMILKDHFLIVPNVVGVIMSFIQLIMYAIYKSKSSSIKAMENIKEGSAHIVKEGIRMQDLDEPQVKIKTLKKGSSFPIPSISKNRSDRKIKKTLSWKSYLLLSGSPSVTDVENGGIMDHL